MGTKVVGDGDLGTLIPLRIWGLMAPVTCIRKDEEKIRGSFHRHNDN